jgi:hypothetical protein
MLFELHLNYVPLILNAVIRSWHLGELGTPQLLFIAPAKAAVTNAHDTINKYPTASD